MLVAGFLAGAYIAFAGLLAIVVSAGLDPATWGGLITLFTGTVFALGLILVIIAGSELLTGNMALLPMAILGRTARMGNVLKSLGIVTIGNLLGSLFVAYFLAVKTGVVTAEVPLKRLTAIATLKPRPRPTGRSSCAPSAATGWSAWRCGWRSAPRTSAARCWRSSSRSWASWRSASTTSWRTCSSCPRRSSRTCRASTGAT